MLIMETALWSYQSVVDTSYMLQRLTRNQCGHQERLVKFCGSFRQGQFVPIIDYESELYTSSTPLISGEIGEDLPTI